MLKSVLGSMLISCLLTLTASPVMGQNWELIKAVKLGTSSERASKGRNNNIYIADVRGSIYQFDQHGNQLNLYSTKQLGQIYLMESWQGLRTFAFYQDLQEYLITDRLLSNERTFQLSSNSYVRLATLSQDLNLWTLTEDNLVLRKLNSLDQSVIIENQWSNEFSQDELDISYLKEYKNRLYLLDKGKRVILFDNLASYITNIEIENVQTISFTDEYLWANQSNQLTRIDLNSLGSLSIPLPAPADHVFIIKDKFYLIVDGGMSIYSYNPL